MSQRTVVLDLASDHQLARDLVAGGVFVPELVELGEHCTLVLRNGTADLELHARCVYVDASRGSGLQLVDCDQDMKHRIMALASGMFGAPASESESESASESASELESGLEPEPQPQPEDLELLTLEPETPARTDDAAADGATDDAAADGTATDDETDEERKIALNVNERLRGLTLVQQLRIAAKGELSERIVLERMYGKNVWEALLRNPRITGHEVARIARMGALPRPLIELIVGNGAWLQIPEVRRALLTNPRLATDHIVRVLRLLPKHELKLAGVQTAYPFAMRDAAKRILREQAG